MEAPAQLEGCVVLSVSDADLFAESSDAKEAFRKTLAQAAGDGVEPEYVQDLTVSVGQSCDARRLAQHGVLVFSSDTEGRRLQEAVKVDYVIVFPAALGTEVAIQVAESSRQILETITVEEVTTILQEEVQNIPVLQNVSVSVTTKNVQEVQITVTSSASDTTATTDVSTFAMVSGLLAILFPVSMFAIWWRCQKRLRPDSDAPGEHAVKPEPCEEDEDEQRSDGGEPAPSDFTAVEPSATPPKSKKKLKPKVKVRRGRRRSLDEDGQAVKHKKRLKPKKTLELESINVIDAEASPQLVPPQLALAPARSFLEDEGVLFDDRPPMPPIISRGSLFSQAELPEDNRAELEDIGVLFDRPPEQVQVVESPPACSFWSESSDADATISRP